MSLVVCTGGNSQEIAFLLLFYFLEKANSCSRCGPPSCCPLIPISHLLPTVVSHTWHPSVLLTCDHVIHFPPLTVCFISLPSTSSIFLPSPHYSSFSSVLLTCSAVAGSLPGSPGSCMSLNSPHAQPSALSAASLHLLADEADLWQRTMCGAAPASKIVSII